MKHSTLRNVPLSNNVQPPFHKMINIVLCTHKVCNYICTGKIKYKILFPMCMRPLGFPNITYYSLHDFLSHNDAVIMKHNMGIIARKRSHVTTTNPVTPNSDGS